MTREEAAKELSYIADEMPSMECADWKEAISIAIKALEKEPTLDKIRERVELEKLGYPPSAEYYKAIMKVLQIIDKERETKYADDRK